LAAGHFEVLFGSRFCLAQSWLIPALHFANIMHKGIAKKKKLLSGLAQLLLRQGFCFETFSGVAWFQIRVHQFIKNNGSGPCSVWLQ
jgi:hypothetical protein